MTESAGRYDQSILIDKFYYRAQFLSTISDNIVFNGNEGITEGILVIILLIYNWRNLYYFAEAMRNIVK